MLKLNMLKPVDSLLTPASFDDSHKKPKIICFCECGNHKSVRLDHFLNGRTLSCGCLMITRTKIANTKYYPVIEDIYNSWLSMMRRCYKTTCNHYKYYGGKGVIVCSEWHSYQNFLDWSLLNEWQEGYEIDKDIKGTGMLYSPENCLWVTSQQNKQHKKRKLVGA